MEEYSEEVNKLRHLGRELDLTEEEINRVIEESFNFLETEGCYDNRDRRTNCQSPAPVRRLWLICVLCVLVMVSASIYYQQSSLPGYRKTVNNYIERNVQELIYPGMKLFRKLMLPVVYWFPSLTGKQKE